MNNNKLNQEFQKITTDYLYHLGLDSSMNLEKDFSAIEYVIFTRSFADADFFAKEYTKAYYHLNDVNITCKTIAKDERYHIYKIANTIVISHGVGSPSMLICLNEVTKFLWHAKVQNFSYIRLTPGGGLGTTKDKPIIIANKAVNYALQPKWSNIEFGSYYDYSTEMPAALTNELLTYAENKAIVGNILSTQSFYNGQARLNGALKTSYTEEQANQYLNTAYAQGVRGIDMESGCFSAFCNEFSIPASIIMATNLNRLNETEISAQSFDKEHIDIGIKKASRILINFLLAKEVNK